jgi:hypothetical protein
MAGVGAPEAPQSNVSAVSARPVLARATSPAGKDSGAGVWVGATVGLGATAGLAATGATVAGTGRSVARAVGLDAGSAALAPQADATTATAVKSARLVGFKVASDALNQPVGDDVEGVGAQDEALNHIRV